jgi:hypothetical protein
MDNLDGQTCGEFKEMFEREVESDSLHGPPQQTDDWQVREPVYCCLVFKSC